MVTYFNTKDLVSFGNYLLSDERRKRFEANHQACIEAGMKNLLPVEENLKLVHHADVENWKHWVESQKFANNKTGSDQDECEIQVNLTQDIGDKFIQLKTNSALGVKKLVICGKNLKFLIGRTVVAVGTDGAPVKIKDDIKFKEHDGQERLVVTSDIPFVSIGFWDSRI